METERITIDSPVSVTGLNIIPVVRTKVRHWQQGHQVATVYSKQPLYVIIAAPDSTRAFRGSGEEVPLHQPLGEVPGLMAVLVRATPPGE